jgi:hypothetical protein
MKYYTGVGSRETPRNILSVMTALSTKLCRVGWTLRSGGAGGADNAFEVGTDHKKQIFIPWNGFNGYSHNDTSCFSLDKISKQLVDIANRDASKIHPAWDKCSRGAKSLHARNIFQVLGVDLCIPSSFLVCYAKEDNEGEVYGGTRTAVMEARNNDIDVFNLYIPYHLERVMNYLKR